MSVQIFRGRTATEARRAAAERLGPGVVVVTTRTVRKPGVAGWFAGSEVEIAATAPEETSERPSELRTKVVPFAPGVYSAPAASSSEPEIAALRAELKGDIRALKTMLAKSDGNSWLGAEIAALRDLIEGMNGPAPRGDRASTIVRTSGIEGPAASVIARKLKGKAPGAEALREVLAETIKLAPWPLEGGRSLVAVVGPTGVGKTTTAAKLAARARMDGRSVTLIGCDAFRVGAVEQLARYADLMDADFLTARTADDLQAAIEGAQTDVVIVDTSGRQPTADGVEIALVPGARARGAGTQRTRHVLLCAPACVRAADAARIAKRYGNLAPTAIAVTKLDETDVPAGLVHATWAARLPLAVVCNGPRVPEDIVPATAAVVLDALAPVANSDRRASPAASKGKEAA